MKRINKIVAITGKYTDKNGAEKNRYATIGTAFQRPDGSLCIKLESIPLGWDGWASLYELDEQKEPRSAAAKSAPAELDDEIPF